MATAMASTPNARRKKRKFESFRNTSLDFETLEDLCNTMQKRCLLDPEMLRLYKAVQEVFDNNMMVRIILSDMTEREIRGIASLGDNFRSEGYKILRERVGNKAFSLVWIDKEVGGDIQFKFNKFFHANWLGKRQNSVISNLNLMRRPRRYSDNSDASSYSNNSGGLVEDMEIQVEQVQVVNPMELANTMANNNNEPGVNQVRFILTYGSCNMESLIESLGEGSSDRMYPPDTAGIFVLSSSLVFTTPINGPGIIQTINNEKRAIGSLLFPANLHFSVKPFLVCNNSEIEGDSFICKVGNDSDQKSVSNSSWKPKLMIMYQFQSIRSATDGAILSSVLQALGVNYNDYGFPLVTAIYKLIDGSVQSVPNKVQQHEPSTFVSGMLLSGDDYSLTQVVTLNLLDSPVIIEQQLNKIMYFFNSFNLKSTSALALVFYHDEVVQQSEVFNAIIKEFRIQCPNEVKLHGIGSLSGVHTMQVDKDADNTFDRVNESMFGLIRKADEVMLRGGFDVTFVLLAYEV